MSNELEEKIFALRKKEVPKEETPLEQPVATQEAVPTDESTQEEKVETIVETSQSDKEQPTSEQEVAPAGWDDTPEEQVSTSSPQIDYSELGSALSFGEIKTKEEFITKASELKAKLKQLEEKPLEGISEEFREVVKVSQDGGDWKEYLASQLLDFSQMNPVEEFEYDFKARAARDPRFLTDGKPDPQKIQDALDTFPEAQRVYEGQRILEFKAAEQVRQRQAMKAKAEAKRQEAERTLATATSKLGELLPLETYGIKFEPKHSQEIYNGIVNSKLTKKHLGQTYEDLVRNGANMKAITRTITLAEKGEKMIAFKADKSKVEAKKEVLKSISNVQLNTSGTNISPEDPEKKVVSIPDKVREHLASQRKGL